MPDVVLFPAVASPLVPAYYLPELIGQPPLVLSFKILADIYLAHIRYRILTTLTSLLTMTHTFNVSPGAAHGMIQPLPL
jgi:hypothetical protein